MPKCEDCGTIVHPLAPCPICEPFEDESPPVLPTGDLAVDELKATIRERDETIKRLKSKAIQACETIRRLREGLEVITRATLNKRVIRLAEAAVAACEDSPHSP